MAHLRVLQSHLDARLTGYGGNTRHFRNGRSGVPSVVCCGIAGEPRWALVVAGRFQLGIGVAREIYRVLFGRKRLSVARAFVGRKALVAVALALLCGGAGLLLSRAKPGVEPGTWLDFFSLPIRQDR